mgnify:FL=1
MKIIRIFTVKKITWLLYIALFGFTILSIYSIINFYQINKFNKDINKGITPELFKQSYEARFSTAFWLAKKEYFKEATILFNNLQEEANNKYKSAIHYNIGNIFFIRGLKINGTSNSTVVRDEAEYLLMQAKKAYIKSIKLDNTHWDAKHNLDRLLTILPDSPTPGVGESDSPGLIMGNIPIGLP